MWPVIVLGALLVGAAVAKKRRQGAPADGEGPLEQSPAPPGQTAAEAAQAAQDALDAAAAGAQQGGPQGAQQAADALEQAAQAAAAAAGTQLQAQVTAIAKQVEDLAKVTAAAAGVPAPSTSSPTTSPGLPPIPPAPTPSTTPVVVVEPAPPAGQPLPPPPRPTDPVITLPTSIPTSVQDVINAAQTAAASLPIPVPIVTNPTQQPPLAQTEQQPQLDPKGTIALARAMIDAETRPNWEGAMKAQIGVWQQKMGLLNDGNFGPKSALTMADEVGVLPIVRAWPRGSDKRAELQKYRDNLHTKAATLENRGFGEHAKALQVSAAFEDGRTFLAGSNPAPVTSAERLQKLDALTRAVA